MEHSRRWLGDTWKLARKDQRGTVEKLCRRDAGVFLRGGPEAEEHPRKM